MSHLLLAALLLTSFGHVPHRAGQDRTDTFQLCDESRVYRVNDPMLVDDPKNPLPVVEVAPEPPESGDALQRYFDEHLVLGPDAANVFVRIHIGFIVDCKGRVGEVAMLSKAMPEVAGIIMKVVAEMPDWKAGRIGGKPADTRVKLVFTVSQGKARVSLPR